MRKDLLCNLACSACQLHSLWAADLFRFCRNAEMDSRLARIPKYGAQAYWTYLTYLTIWFNRLFRLCDGWLQGRRFKHHTVVCLAVAGCMVFHQWIHSLEWSKISSEVFWNWLAPQVPAGVASKRASWLACRTLLSNSHADGCSQHIYPVYFPLLWKLRQILLLLLTPFTCSCLLSSTASFSAS